MKTRSKLLLAAVSLLTVSVAATATSAYAWYTANRQVSAKLTQMGVQATSGTLEISRPSGILDSFSDNEITTSTISNLEASASNKALTDVSSKGDGEFIKPKFSHNNSTIVEQYTQSGNTIGKKTVTLSNGVSGTPTPAAITAYGVISLAIQIENSGDSNSAGAIDVYIDPTKTSLKSDLASAQDSARFSIIEVVKQNEQQTNTLYMYCSPTAAPESTYEYLSGSGSSISKTTLKDDGTENDKLIQDKAEGKLFKKQSVPSPATHTKSDGYLCSLDAGSSKTYLITMWVEGTDPDCKVKIDDSTTTSLEDSILATLSLSLGLYALEA